MNVHTIVYITGVVSSIGSVSTSSMQGSDSGFGPSSSSGPCGTIIPTCGDTTEFSSTAYMIGERHPTMEGGAVGLGSSSGVLLQGPDGKPDLSHLTVEERAIIENVMHRQQSEESKEVEFLR